MIKNTTTAVKVRLQSRPCLRLQNHCFYRHFVGMSSEGVDTISLCWQSAQVESKKELQLPARDEAELHSALGCLRCRERGGRNG